MCAVLPVLSFILLVWLFKRSMPGVLWREAGLCSAVACGVLVLVSTEALSVVHALRFPYVAAFWGLSAALLGAVHVQCRFPLVRGLPALRFVPAYETFLFLLMFAVVGTAGIIAAVVPPNTWDSMTYHMARVAHWIQNGTVAFYPTAIDRQLFFNPWAEYAIAQGQILSQGLDVLANFVQWCSLLGVLAGVSLMSRWLGAGRAGQLLTAACAATLPNAITQATSTQNDLVAALWGIAAVYFMLSNLREPRLRHALPAAGAVLLGVYTKSSVFLMIGPFFLWMAWHMWRAPGHKASMARQKFGLHVALMTAALVLGCLGVFVRNGLILGSMISPDEREHTFTSLDGRGMASSALLHLGMHLRLGFPAFDNPLGAGMEWVHERMGSGVMTSSANHFKLPFNYKSFPFHEDEIPNFLPFVCALAAFVHFVLRRRGELGTPKGMFVLMSWGCFMLFNITVKWSPFDGRYHLPYFMLLLPLVADTALRWKAAKYVLPLLLAANALIFLGWNASKPLVKYAPGVTPVFQASRDERYFYNQPGSAGAYRRTAAAVMGSGCRDVGIYIGSDTWEYPLWVFLQKDTSPLRLEHVLVDNASKKLPFPLGPFSPCVIVSSPPLPVTQVGGEEYISILNPGGLYLAYSRSFVARKQNGI